VQNHHCPGRRRRSPQLFHPFTAPTDPCSLLMPIPKYEATTPMSSAAIWTSAPPRDPSVSSPSRATHIEVNHVRRDPLEHHFQPSPVSSRRGHGTPLMLHRPWLVSHQNIPNHTGWLTLEIAYPFIPSNLCRSSRDQRSRSNEDLCSRGLLQWTRFMVS
jgi:hypothetical protein